MLIDAQCSTRTLAEHTVDEDGTHDECTWCGFGDGTDVLMCSTEGCPRVYCGHCIVRNLGSDYWDKLQAEDDDAVWNCPHCDLNDPLKDHKEATTLVLNWPDDIVEVSIDVEKGRVHGRWMVC